MSSWMLKKKPSGKPAGGDSFSLFVNGTKKARDDESAGRTPPADVIDVEAIERPSAQTPDTSPKAEAPVEAPETATEEIVGAAGLRIKRTVSRKDPAAPAEPVADEKPAAKGGLFSKLRAKKPAPAEAPFEQPEKVAPAPQAKEEASGLLKFKAKKARPVPEADAKADKSAKKPLFGLGLRKAAAKDKATEGARAAKTEKTAKPARQAKAAARRKATGLGLAVTLDDGKTVYWQLEGRTLRHAEPGELSRVACFARDDIRIATEAALSYRQAADLALAEIGEECRIINESKTLHAVYGRSYASLQALECPAGPGLLMVERLLAKQPAAEGRDTITGVLLTDESSGISLAVLYHVSAKGTVSEPQVTVNPDNLDFTLSQFASSHRVMLDEARVRLFNNEELLSVAADLVLYPVEPLWHGIPVRKVVLASAVACTAAAVVACGWSATQYLQVRDLTARQTALRKDITRLDAQLQDALSGSLHSFAKTQSLELPVITERAASLWRPHTRVSLEATPAREVYSVAMPLTRNPGGRPSALGRLLLQDVTPLISLEAPEGCSKEQPGLTGGLNAIQITVVCENTSGSLARYRID